MFVGNVKAMEQFLEYLNQQPNIYFKEVDGRLHSISKEEFDKLDNFHKLKVLSLIERVVAAITGEIPLDQTPAKIQLIRQAYLGFLEDKTILSINESRLAMIDVLPPTIETMKEALEWLKKSGVAHLLRYADFDGFADMTNEDLEELIQICPNLVYLHFESDFVDEIPELPASLLEFHCSGESIEAIPPLPPYLKVLSVSSTSIRELPDLPDSLKVLNCSSCDFLEKWPKKLPLFLEVDCSFCCKLEPIPNAILSSLIILRNEFGTRGCKNGSNKLPTLWETVFEDVGEIDSDSDPDSDNEISAAKRDREGSQKAGERNVRNKPGDGDQTHS